MRPSPAPLALALTLTIALARPGLPAGDAAASPGVTVNGYVQETAVMVSARDLLPALGLTCKWDPAADRITIGGAAGSLSFTSGAGVAAFTPADGAQAQTRPLNVAPAYVGSLLQVPVPDLVAAMDLSVSVEERTATRVRYTIGGRQLTVSLWPKVDKTVLDVAKGSVVKLCTDRGDIHLELFERQTPVAAGNFLDLVLRGFYDGLTFHRVVTDFMIQGGCPRGDGSGGPGFTIPDEADRGLRHQRGSLSMAKTPEPDTGGSQFFICHWPQPHLDGIHTVFGRCLAGMEVVDAMPQGGRIVKAEVLRQSADAVGAMEAARGARVTDQQ